MKKNLEQIAKEDSRYGISAIRFVYEGLGYTAKNVASEPKHVSGQTLCEGLRKPRMDERTAQRFDRRLQQCVRFQDRIHRPVRVLSSPNSAQFKTQINTD